jgi:transcriptional regulator with XRE-family HTH domain
MNTVERIKAICKERKIAISKLEKDCGFSNGYIGQLRKGTVPDDRLIVIAEYLNLSVEYLMTGKEQKPDYLYTDENTEFLIEVTKMAKDKDFVARMKKYMELMKDSKKSVDDMIDFLHAKEHQGED